MFNLILSQGNFLLILVGIFVHKNNYNWLLSNKTFKSIQQRFVGFSIGQTWKWLMNAEFFTERKFIVNIKKRRGQGGGIDI